MKKTKFLQIIEINKIITNKQIKKLKLYLNNKTISYQNKEDHHNNKEKEREREEEEDNLVILEGNRLIKDAIKYKLKPFQIFITKNNINNIQKEQEEQNKEENKEYSKILMKFSDIIYLIDDHMIQKISNVKNSQGIIALFHKPILSSNFKKVSLTQKPLVLICDRLSDPGNLGSIIRSSYIFGVDVIFAIETCSIWVYEIFYCVNYLLFNNIINTIIVNIIFFVFSHQKLLEVQWDMV